MCVIWKDKTKYQTKTEINSRTPLMMQNDKLLKTSYYTNIIYINYDQKTMQIF